MRICPFDFSDYRDYLNVVRENRLVGKRAVSLHLWARRLGYRSPRSMAMVFKGQRLPSGEMIERLSRELKHSDSEHRYFELLIQLERCKRRGGNVQAVLEALEKVNPKKINSSSYMDYSTFSHISDWYYFALNQLVDSPTFKEDLAWIRKRLRSKPTVSQLQRALHTMLQLNILRRERGRLKSNMARSETLSKKSVPALQRFLKQMAQLGLEAIDEQPVPEREFDSTTFRMSLRDMPKAKAALLKFRDEFMKEFHKTRGNDVFQFNLQLFRLTTDVPKEKL